MRRPTAFLVCVALLGLAGCASWLAPEDAGFGEVQKTVSDRTGYDLAWNRSFADAGGTPRVVDVLLGDGVTLREAVQIALLNNRRLQATYEQLGIARADLIQASLPRNPVLAGVVKVHEDDSDKEVIELSFAHEFLSALLIPLRRAKAKASFERAQRRVTDEVLGLAARTRIAYYRLQAAERTLAMQHTILAAGEAMYDVAGRLHDAGNISELRRANERALYESMRVAVTRSEARVADRRETLNTLMGLYGTHTVWRTEGELPEPQDADPTLEHIETMVLRRSLDLQAARRHIEILRSRLGIARVRSFVPELGIGAEGEREPDGVWFLGPMLEYALPIFDWGQGRRRKATAMLRQAYRSYTALAVELRAEARRARMRLQAARRQAEHYRTVILPLRERITNETQLRYNAMQMGVFHLLEAKQAEIDTRRQYIERLRDYWIARTHLDMMLQGHMPDGGMAMDRAEPDDDGGH